MTVQEALEALKIEQIQIEGKAVRVAKFFEGISVANEALEKQIPKKPRVLKVHDISGYKYGDCFCGEHIMDDEKYCSNCGQALDWGDSE